MDDKNINTSFDALFENNRDWIVTKNEKGKTKVAVCKEDEMDELYISKTNWHVRVTKEANEKTVDNVPKWRLYGAAMFLLRDMLNCETRNGYFICKEIPFMDVLICGTVVSLSIRFDKYAIVVDDGTSSVMCLMKQEEFKALKRTDEEVKADAELLAAYKKNPTDPYLKADVGFISSIVAMDKTTPKFEDLELGDVITIIGTLSEYNGKRYVFMKTIDKEPEDSFALIKHLEKILDLYENYYLHVPKFSYNRK